MSLSPLRARPGVPEARGGIAARREGSAEAALPAGALSAARAARAAREALAACALVAAACAAGCTAVQRTPGGPGETSAGGDAARIALATQPAAAPGTAAVAGSPPAVQGAQSPGVQPDQLDPQQRGQDPRQAGERPRVMVTLRPAPPTIWLQLTQELERTYRLRTVYAWTLSSLGERCIVFEPLRPRSTAELLQRLAADPRIEVVQLVQRFTTMSGAYREPDARLQHSALALHLEQAHRWATGRGVRVAVVDTGVDLDHPDLRGRIAKTGNFVDHGESTFTSDIHGTAVTGVIAAGGNGEIGIVGVAPQARIFALKACWQQTPGARQAVCDSYTLAKAIDFAIAEGAQVLNFSLAGPPDPLLAKLIANALKRGIVVVAAEGPDPARSFPSTLPGVLDVAASDDLQGGLRSPAPPRGRRPRSILAAPGVDILTTVPHGHYDFFSGSSLAAAQVSGVAALLLEREPKISPTQLAALFHKTAKPILAAAGDPTPSIDQVDACAALASALGGGACS
jgi:hypothetical protein